MLQAGDVRFISVCSSVVADIKTIPILSPKLHWFTAKCSKVSVLILIVVIVCVIRW